MIVACHRCQARVDAKVIGQHEVYDPDQMPEPIRVSLLVCPACGSPLVAQQFQYYMPPEGEMWTDATRVWPQPVKDLSYPSPPIVHSSLIEADKCLQSGAFTAAVAMCGRALEGVCRHFKTKTKYLGGGIRELREKGVIDDRLYRWSEELHRHRNIAAHAGTELITQRDAADLFTFVLAICEYIFDLSAKFEAFVQRQQAASESDPA